ncbi:beta-glucosidase [Neobacillus cucumis]|uniref:beta-glucosidase n=1 Tax=Neobacillus cucumis TaxID=1740721 RepID=UPI0019658334|nr:glycoside hydrolase family 3 C-terminal domain-containing protein [Neobacillus cucumis]MBM7653187.1 beta-glucosidase [Neobacillus cucumis]
MKVRAKKVRKVLSLILAFFVMASVALVNGPRANALSVPGNHDLSRKIAGEGMVLLENHGGLPLNHGQSIALFGIGQINFQKGGGGSGNVNVDYVINLLQGMQNKQASGEVKIYQPLTDAYQKYVTSSTKAEMPLADDQVQAAANNADTAIVTISRFSSEGSDKKAIKGDYYLSDDEVSMLDKVTKAGFKKVVVVLNVGAVIDTSWIANFPGISVLVAWQPGMEGGNAVSDVLTGDVNPSGKLVDTFAKSYNDYPSANNFDQYTDHVSYEEDIFVGYRYFETFDPTYQKVNYPFGYGLSYTTFDISNVHTSVEDDIVNVVAKVTNTGKVSGKEVVQAYFSAPQGKLGKPGKELAAFAKTKLIEPGKSDVVHMSYDVNDMSSYDDTGIVQKSAYVLEPGDYNIFVGNSIKDAGEKGVRYTYKVNKLAVTEQLSKEQAPIQLDKRLLADGTYETLTPATSSATTQEVSVAPTQTVQPPQSKLMLKDVYENPSLMDQFLTQLSDAQLADLSQGKRAQIAGGTGGIGGLADYGIPSTQTSDGPAGLRLTSHTTAWPVETLLACTWNVDLVKQMGEAVGKEAQLNNVDLWLAPAMNIHRNPLNGRNFEYFSEDPLITGKMSSAITSGVQLEGVGVTIKHFAANNKEVNRNSSDSRMSERALREIYLKGFEIAVKEAQPWAVMSSYNLINGKETSESKDLLTDILRSEWGYKGMVMTDWGNNSTHYKEAKTGNDVKMPSGNTANLLSALASGDLTRQELERNIKNVLNMVMKTQVFKKRVLHPMVTKISQKENTRVKAMDFN